MARAEPTRTRPGAAGPVASPWEPGPPPTAIVHEVRLGVGRRGSGGTDPALARRREERSGTEISVQLSQKSEPNNKILFLSFELS